MSSYQYGKPYCGDKTILRPSYLQKSNNAAWEKLELERLLSEDTPPTNPWLPILLTSSYWIPSQKKTKSKLQIWRIWQNFKFLNFEKLLDTMCKYEMDPASIIEDTELTQFCPQTDKRTRWNQHTPLQLHWAYNKAFRERQHPSAPRSVNKQVQ